MMFIIDIIIQIQSFPLSYYKFLRFNCLIRISGKLAMKSEWGALSLLSSAVCVQ